MTDTEVLLPKFIEYLKERVAGNYTNAYFIVKAYNLKADSETLHAVLTCQNAFRDIKREHQRGLLTQEEWSEKLKLATEKMDVSLSSLELDELEEGVLEGAKAFLPIEDIQNTLDTEGGIDAVTMEDLKDAESRKSGFKRLILERIEIDKIIIPENSDMLSLPEKRFEFRKNMMAIQDNLLFGNHGKAYDDCLVVLNTLELQSAQLYEYVTISYFKLKGGEHGIVQDIENQDETSLKQLALHIFRCRLFDKDRNKTETFEANVAFICQRITKVLRERYAAIKFSYIFGDDNALFRLQIQKYIQTSYYVATELYKGNNPNLEFLSDALIELNSGSRLEWFDVTSDWQIRNKDAFPALQLRQNIGNLLKNKGVLEEIKTDLYRKLALKYSAIRTPQYGVTLHARKSLRRYFKAAIVAYKFFDDTRFLELFKEELLHNGKIEWFSLDDSGLMPKIVANAECLELDYDPFKDWLRLKTKFDETTFDEATKKLIEDLAFQNKKKLVENSVAETDAKYEKCKNSNRLEVIECMRVWLKAYNDIPNEDYINRCIKVLIGEKDILFWFELTQTGDLINHRECTQMNFDSTSYLTKWIDHSLFYTNIKAGVWSQIRFKAAEILAQQADQNYSSNT